MMKTLIVFLFILTGCSAPPKISSAPDAPEPPGRYADINGIRMYYEFHGKQDGIPLVLLHGGGSTIDVSFGRILPFLAKDFRIIALEEQGHGRTSDRNEPFRFATSAEDVATLLKKLKVEKADLFGFSNGASTMLEVTLHHPELVRKLVFAGSMTTRAGGQPGFFDMFKKVEFSQMPQPLKDAFLKVNPSPEKLRNMFDKDVERMLHFTEIQDKELKKVQAPTLVIAGDKDVVTVKHAKHIAHVLPHGKVAILEGAHGEYLGEALEGKPGSKAPETTAALIRDFLEH